MPTKSLEAQLDARGVLGNFPRFGKLRKGAPKTEKGAGRDQDYFRLTLETNYEHIRPAFEKIFTTEPREFTNVFLAADSPDQAFQYWKEEWAHARLLRRCDEETIHVHWDGNIPGYDSAPTACTCNPLDRDCKDHGRMDIVIPALFDLTGEWGKFTVETTSIYDVIALRSYMKMANEFMQKLPNTAFWSIPFTIGRALRTVPVTINGKRSLKPMSLLYAKIDPQFNQQVFTPMLMRPAQLLLAGVNPETGELPGNDIPDLEPDIEADFIQAASWDRDYVNAQTMHLFEGGENHQANAIDKMIADGILTDLMDDNEVIAMILDDRQRRNVEKQTEQAAKNGSKSRKKGSKPSAADEQAQSDIDWLKNGERANAFIQQATVKLGLNMGDILDALKWCSVDQIQTIEEFAGTPAEAWGACIAHKCGYDLEAVARFVPDHLSPGRFMAEKLINRHAMPF